MFHFVSGPNYISRWQKIIGDVELNPELRLAVINFFSPRFPCFLPWLLYTVQCTVYTQAKELLLVEPIIPGFFTSLLLYFNFIESALLEGLFRIFSMFICWNFFFSLFVLFPVCFLSTLLCSVGGIHPAFFCSSLFRLQHSHDIDHDDGWMMKMKMPALILIFNDDYDEQLSRQRWWSYWPPSRKIGWQYNAFCTLISPSRLPYTTEHIMTYYQKPWKTNQFFSSSNNSTQLRLAMINVPQKWKEILSPNGSEQQLLPFYKELSGQWGQISLDMIGRFWHWLVKN